MYLNSECKFINQVEDLREIVSDEIYKASDMVMRGERGYNEEYAKYIDIVNS